MRPKWIIKPELNDGRQPELEYATAHWPGYIGNDDFPLGYNNVAWDGTNPQLWCSMDNQEAFEKNKLTMPPSWRYHKKKVEYRYNRAGYRTYDWSQIDWKNAIVLFGDSCTFGEGLASDETIDAELCRLSGRQVVNLGIPAGSNSQMFNLSLDMLEKFGTPYSVVMNWSTADRFRYFHKTGYYESGPWDSYKTFTKSNNIDGVNMTQLWMLTNKNEYHIMCNNYYVGKSARALWENRTKYVSISYFNDSAHYMRVEKKFTIDNDARDRVHPGPGNSLSVATYINNKLNQR